jgi:hypothetical protein
MRMALPEKWLIVLHTFLGFQRKIWTIKSCEKSAKSDQGSGTKIDHRKFVSFSFLINSGPSEGLKNRGCQYYLVGIIDEFYYFIIYLSYKEKEFLQKISFLRFGGCESIFFFVKEILGWQNYCFSCWQVTACRQGADCLLEHIWYLNSSFHI